MSKREVYDFVLSPLVFFPLRLLARAVFFTIHHSDDARHFLANFGNLFTLLGPPVRDARRS